MINVKYKTFNMSDETNQKNAVLGPNTVLFILSIIVIANVDEKKFHDLDYQTYYYLIAMILYSTVAIYIGTIVLCFSVPCSDNKLCNIIQLVMASLPFIFLGLMFVFIGMIWHHDPNHSVVFYKEFWTEWAFEVHNEKAPFYYMTDVLVRIYSTCMLVLSCIMPCILCVLFGMLCSNKKKGTPATVGIL